MKLVGRPPNATFMIEAAWHRVAYQVTNERMQVYIIIHNLTG
jgi:hypothetical protein